MKSFVLLLFFTHSFLALGKNNSRYPQSQETNFKMNAEDTMVDKEYEWKSHTTCSERAKGSDPVYPNLPKVNYYICPDKTISHGQPASRGFNGWEGYCGQTAVSNISSMICKRHMSPQSNDFYGTDISPGQSPQTVNLSLRKVFSEVPKTNTCPKVTWNLRTHWKKSSFLKSVRGDLFGSKNKIKRFRSENTYVYVTPTPVLLNSGGLNFHWVTVVDIIENKLDKYKCDVIVNTWGDQKTLTCERFVSYSDHSGISQYTHLGFD
jgi:hypothetical protein